MSITALNGTVALVTGASSGIGDATARRQRAGGGGPRARGGGGGARPPAAGGGGGGGARRAPAARTACLRQPGEHGRGVLPQARAGHEGGIRVAWVRERERRQRLVAQ